MGILTIDINGTCNLECKFCYSDLDGSELNKEQILEIVSKKPEFNIVEIGGGEPFIHNDIGDIIKEIVKKDKLVHISTNATQIPEEILDLENDIRKNVVIQVSIHASNNEVYQKITGKDFFETVIENTKKIKQYYNTVMNTVIYQENFSQVQDILQISYDLDIQIRVMPVIPIGKGKNVELITSKQINELINILLTERIKNPNVDSPLIHLIDNTPAVNCPTLADAYNLKLRGICPANIKQKEYYNSKGECKYCEFQRRNN